MKNGFTLVELSIVLVIIGLLIGGILVGQSLIDSARLNSFVKQMQQYDIATSNHRQKYNSWPGDNDILGYTFRQGNAVKNDGLICDDDCAENGWLSHYELGKFFPELAMLNGVRFDDCPMDNLALYPTTSGSQCNTPLGKLGENNTIVIGRSGTYSTSPYYNRNFYFHTNCSGMTNYPFSSRAEGGCTPVFTGIEAMSYDSKIDDGIPNSGNVLGRVSNFTSTMRVTGFATSYSTTGDVDTILMQVILPDQP